MYGLGLRRPPPCPPLLRWAHSTETGDIFRDQNKMDNYKINLGLRTFKIKKRKKKLRSNHKVDLHFFMSF